MVCKVYVLIISLFLISACTGPQKPIDPPKFYVYKVDYQKFIRDFKGDDPDDLYSVRDSRTDNMICTKPQELEKFANKTAACSVVFDKLMDVLQKGPSTE